MTDVVDPARVWSTVAVAWDAHVDYIDDHSGESTAAMVARVAVREGDRVLELAAGPGGLAATWSDLVGSTGRVVLSDIAPGMVEVARRRAEPFANVEVAVSDAAAIDFADGSFDVVASRMGLMFVPDPSVALSEIHRVLAASGRFGALVWGGIEHNPWMTCVGMAATAAGIAKGGPPVGPGGMFSLGDPDQLAALAKDAGFVDVSVGAHPVAMRSEGIDAHLQHVSSLAGPLADAFQHATPDQLATFRRTAADLAAPYSDDDGLNLPGLALLVTGRRP
ncbi:MAG: class I SAM-dependent methyltransferase [Actinobacteria bacterium]|nr:class I SAM-dependent methyltransferase [Actinomycetota bacterium]MBV9255376.1 class I SAM-dependent methyltransferase [Actinomycetota bacterium]